ncbi:MULTISPECIES: hypothetical protein [Hyphomicrobiales]|uniref:Uncharacterized protein n=1 Tax=Prosthecodimorpha staleyi TaxID=2840188 RepID=A0A947D6W4_9HYPH|nr:MULTISPECIES: hypothetical protein [Hyphomicrobiales]MBT9292185.1 hypothetical protein [Prosthecodimorpha staleyi]MCW1839182.1 hypothetical protein [Prosthecomicrobium hirschii]
MTLRKITGSASASCATGEMLISAMCTGTMQGPIMTSDDGATCNGDGAKVVLVCAK